MVIRVLDSSDNNGELTAADVADFDVVIPKLYDPARNPWTANALRVIDGEGKHLQVYSADQSFGWDATTQIMAALDLDPAKVGVWIDWWEFRVGPVYHWPSDRAVAEVHAGVDAAHAAKCLAGGYGSEFYGWPNFVGIPFDAAWVANPVEPHRPYDLHQYAKDPSRGDLDVVHVDLTLDAYLARLVVPPTPPPPGGDDLTAAQAAQLQAVYSNVYGQTLYVMQKPRPDPKKAPAEAAGWDQAAAAAKVLA